MSISHPEKRRIVLALSRMAVAICVVGLSVSAWGFSRSGVSPAGAAGSLQGPVTLSVTSGDSTTPFTISLPAFSACAEDSAAGGWTVTSFMVPTAVDLNTLTFDSGGPTPASVGGAYADFRQPLWLVGGDAYLSRQTVNATPPDPSGPIVDPGTFDFNPGYAAGDIPAGAYNIGIACVDETTAIQQYWYTGITVTADPADPGTADISWELAAEPPPTTTTTTGEGSTTTTTDGSGTTTTTAVENTGPPLELSPDTLSAGESVTIRSSGWQASSAVEIFLLSSLLSEPVPIGSLTADGNGDIDGSVTVPADTQPGLHTILALGLDTSGVPTASAADVTVQGADEQQPTGGNPSAASPVTTAGQLPYTGSSPVPMVVWAVALLVFGRIAMLVGKRTKVIGDDPTG
jgi:hypothetical protein